MGKQSAQDEELAVADYPLPGPDEASALVDLARGRRRRCHVALGVCGTAAALAAVLHAGGAGPRGVHSIGEEKGVTALAAVPSAEEEPCLCAFDIDRTLTCKQGWADQCEGTVEQPGTEDSAFSGGGMIFSQAAANIQDTFCGKCLRAIVSAGDAGGEGSGERGKLLEVVGGTESSWQDINYDQNAEVSTPLVVHAVDGNKQDSVRSILEWARNHQGMDIKDARVWFFDDLLKNVEGFRGSGFNARQVSCKSRGPVEQWVSWDGKIGGCGAVVDEIVPEEGVHICEGVPLKPEGLDED
mmetsp:Transcript_63632/g.169096  ORF Transcript_63632/g.169096 Transcript_63632/m.169096 type:complete len:298 (+) Transcript_63632:57-950(+)